MTFPSYIPTDRRYVHGAWPISRHKFMSNTEQRVLHATAKTGQEIRLTYSNQTTEVVQQFLYHYDAMYGMQYAFELPDEVYAGWTESKKLMGNKQLWQYKDVPRITSQKGEIATLQVTLVAAPTQAIRAPEPAAESGDGGDGGGEPQCPEGEVLDDCGKCVPQTEMYYGAKGYQTSCSGTESCSVLVDLTYDESKGGAPVFDRAEYVPGSTNENCGAFVGIGMSYYYKYPNGEEVQRGQGQEGRC